MKKEFVISLLCLMFSLNLSAYSCCLQEDQFYTNSCEDNYDYEVEFAALFLKVSGSNADNPAQVIPADLPASHNIFTFRPHFQFGFDLAVRKFFNSRKTNLFAEWLHYKSVLCAPQEHGPFFAFNPSVSPSTSPFVDAHIDHKFSFNLVNLTYAQAFEVNDYFVSEFFFGMNFSHLIQTYDFVYSTLPEKTTNCFNHSAVFNGAGPLCGFKCTYDICKQFKMRGRVLAMVIAGPFTGLTPFQPDVPADLSTANQQLFKERVTHVLFGFGDHVGIQYAYKSDNGKYLLKLEVGYIGLIYVNPSQPLITSSEALIFAPDGPNTTVAHVFPPLLSMFAALSGPYFLVSLAF